MIFLHRKAGVAPGGDAWGYESPTHVQCCRVEDSPLWDRDNTARELDILQKSDFCAMFIFLTDSEDFATDFSAVGCLIDTNLYLALPFVVVLKSRGHPRLA